MPDLCIVFVYNNNVTQKMADLIAQNTQISNNHSPRVSWKKGKNGLILQSFHEEVSHKSQQYSLSAHCKIKIINGIAEYCYYKKKEQLFYYFKYF